MRLLSLAARGGFLERALSDMRKVVGTVAPVRLGTHQKDDGTQVPKWHDSEVAAIAYAIQNILARRARQHSPVVQEPAQGNAPMAAMPPCDGGQEVLGVWRACHDSQGRLRLLHPVRSPGNLW